MEPIMVYYDNKRCIKLTNNPMFHDYYKHLDIQYHFLGDKVKKSAVNIEHV